MPVFALKLEFDDKGAVTAIRQLDKVSNAAGDAQSELQLFTTQARQTGASLDSLASKAKKLAGALTLGLGLRELNQLRKNLTRAASDAEETANKFNVVFGSVKKQADLAAESLALDYGMSRQGAQAVLAQTGDLLTGLGLGADKALSLAEQVAQLGTDLASFSNYAGGAEGAIDALTKALLGETEQAKMLGVVLGETQMEEYAKSVGKTWGQLDLVEKAQLRLNAAIKQSPNAVGDFARSMGSYANQVRVADAILQDFVTSIGQGLLPATTQALVSINSNRDAIDELGQSLGAGLGNALDTVVQNFEEITEAVKLAAVAYGTYTVAQRLLTSEFIKGVKAGAQEELAAYRARQAAREASIETARATQEAAAAKMRETELTLANIRAKQDHTVSQRQIVRNAALETKAMRELAAAQTALIQANNALAAAEGRSSMAMGAKAGTAAKAAGAAATVAGTAFRGLGAGVKGLVSLMGGPWVAALTVAGTVLYKLHAEAQENEKVIADLAARYRELHEAAQEAGEGIRQASQLELNREAANAQLEMIKAQVVEEKALIEVRKLSSGQPGFFDPNWMWDARDIMRDFREGTLDAAAAVSKLRKLMRENPEDANDIAHYMDAIYARLQSIEERRGAEKTLKATEDAASGLGTAAGAAATELDGLASAMALLEQSVVGPEKDLAASIEWLRKYTSGTESAKNELAALNKEKAQSILLSLQEAEAIARASGDIERAAALAREYRAQSERVAQVGEKPNNRRSGKSEMQRKAEEAARTLADLQDKIARLNMDEPAYREFALGRKIDELRKKYPQLTATIQEYEAAQRKAWGDESVHAEQDKAKDDLQTTVDFYRELRELSGKYTLGLAEQNRLIALQAEAYRRNGIPEPLVKEWELLQKLQSDTTGWGGVRRAAKSYYADSMNWGKQFESLTTSVMGSFVDTMTDGLMQGKLSFSDFANSLIRDIMRISLQASTARIMESLIGNTGNKTDWGGIFGKVIGAGVGALAGGFSGGSGGIANTPKIGSKNAHGNVFSSGLEPWSNTVVAQPTFFDASRQLAAYARGGVFGEAGPEAVMPLTRMSGGELGVKASFGGVRGFSSVREAMDWRPGQDMEKAFAETTRMSMRMLEESRQRMAQERAQAASAPKINLVINNNAPGVDVSQEQRENSDGSIDIEVMIDQIMTRKMAQRGSSTNNFMRKGLGINLPPIRR